MIMNIVFLIISQINCLVCHLRYTSIPRLGGLHSRKRRRAEDGGVERIWKIEIYMGETKVNNEQSRSNMRTVIRMYGSQV